MDTRAYSAVEADRLHLPALDGIRVLAFLLVLIHHSGPPQGSPAWLLTLRNVGWIGVDIFLASSAYLLFRKLLAEHHSTGRISVGAFYARRLLRIYPLMAVFPLLAVALFGVTTPLQAAKRYIALLMLSDNTATMFAGMNNAILHTGHLWTLSFEFQVYAVLPLLAFALARFGLRTFALALLGSCAVAAMFRYGLVVAGVLHPTIYVTPMVRPESVIVGLLLAAGLTIHPLLALVGLTSSLWLIVSCLAITSPDSQLAIYPLAAVAAGAALVVGVRFKPLASLLASRPMRELGKMVFGLYVFHYPIATLAAVNFPHVAYPLRLGASLALSVACAAVSYYAFERPILKYKDKWFGFVPRPL